jgi:hypothetical protein
VQLSVGGAPVKLPRTVKEQQPFGFAGMPVLAAQVPGFNRYQMAIGAHFSLGEGIAQILKGKIRKATLIPVQRIT